ncbi:MAG: Ig-like domain-containing protein, partial [Anaerovoracaceae bacterium]
SLSRSQMESIGGTIYNYSNITSVGTVMETIAQGPTVNDILNQVGIDPASAQTLNLRTTDGSAVNNWFTSLNMNTWVNSSRYYYPNLRGNYDNKTGEVLPLPSASAGSSAVPAIIAIRSYATKSPSEKITASQMGESESYRFCAGQPHITEGVSNTAVTSASSAKWIYGIDVTLFGSPKDATSLSLNINNPNVKVGSIQKISAVIKGQELFEDLVSQKLKWKSSDTSIATVDANGNVTVHKIGVVTITATTENGISQSITLNGKAGKPKAEGKGSGNTSDIKTGTGNSNDKNKKEAVGDSKNDSNKASAIAMEEIVLTASTAPEVSEETISLPPEDRGAGALGKAGGMAGLCLASGGIWQIIRFRKQL